MGDRLSSTIRASLSILGSHAHSQHNLSCSSTLSISDRPTSCFPPSTLGLTGNTIKLRSLKERNKILVGKTVKYRMDSFQPDVRTKRLKPFWRALMISNLALAAYLFAAEKKKDKKTRAKAAVSVPRTPLAMEHVQQPIPAERKPNIDLGQPDHGQQANGENLHPSPSDKPQELYNWMLEEENKRKPKDHEEEKRIDEEKAILKEFLRSESTPRI